MLLVRRRAFPPAGGDAANRRSGPSTIGRRREVSNSSDHDVREIELPPFGTCGRGSFPSVLQARSMHRLSFPRLLGLRVPSSARAILRTTAAFVQGELVVDPPDAGDGLRVLLVGMEDVACVPPAENANVCEVGACNAGSEAVVVRPDV